MLQSLREETGGKLQMLLALRKNGPTSLFKEVTGFSRNENRREKLFWHFLSAPTLAKHFDCWLLMLLLLLPPDIAAISTVVLVEWKKQESIFGQGMRTATFQFSESGGSVNDPNLFTELPVDTELPPPFSLKTLFFTEKCFVASPSQKSTLKKVGCKNLKLERRADNFGQEVWE